jgi:hypothetical protein
VLKTGNRGRAMAAPHVRLVELLRASPRSVFSADARGCVFAVSDSATAEDWVKVLAKDPGTQLSGADITDPAPDTSTGRMGRCAQSTYGCDAIAGALLRAVRSGDNTAVAGLIDIAQADLQVVDGVRAPQ